MTDRLRRTASAFVVTAFTAAILASPSADAEERAAASDDVLSPLHQALERSAHPDGPAAAFRAEVDHHHIVGDVEIYVTGVVAVDPSRPAGERVTVEDYTIVLPTPRELRDIYAEDIERLETASNGDVASLSGPKAGAAADGDFADLHTMARALLNAPFDDFDFDGVVGVGLTSSAMEDVRWFGDGVYAYRPVATAGEGADARKLREKTAATVTVTHGCVSQLWSRLEASVTPSMTSRVKARNKVYDYDCTSADGPPVMKTAFETLSTSAMGVERRTEWNVRVIRVTSRDRAASSRAGLQETR